MAVKLSQGLKLKQSQTLTMTPQLQQAIKMLTLTHTELTEVIATEMVENPMLEEFGAEVNVDQKSESDYKVDKLENQTKEAVAENFEELDMDLSSGERIHLCKFSVKDLKKYSTIIYRYKLLPKT